MVGGWMDPWLYIKFLMFDNFLFTAHVTTFFFAYSASKRH